MRAVDREQVPLDGSNGLSMDELRLAEIFCKRGRGGLVKFVIETRKVQIYSFALGTDCALSDQQTTANLFRGLDRAFSS
ncbi:hypothetical protein ACRALDRAFT_1066085 [Sodiomyces alcalophilus JCM 7366]|uniref:uncharacterized protein n=1 Tax=Sodiomyces alcalophilus JCM 7366 TaxID=591952 RepID=UPI0039B57A46